MPEGAFDIDSVICRVLDIDSHILQKRDKVGF
jgi:hypothetical protein